MAREASTRTRRDAPTRFNPKKKGMRKGCVCFTTELAGLVLVVAVAQLQLLKVLFVLSFNNMDCG